MINTQHRWPLPVILGSVVLLLAGTGLFLTVRGGFAPGPHVLFLRRQGGDASEEYAYGLDVEASP